MTNQPEWTFIATLANPEGIRVTATITVPVDAAWKDVREVAELAQMVASRGMSDVGRSREASERMPF